MINIKLIPVNTEKLADRSKAITIIVVHYTVQDFKSIYRNFQRNIENDTPAAPYVIDTNGDIYKFADDKKIVRHAGVSSWNGQHNINQYSIGIEIINFGHSENDLGDGVRIKGSNEFWYNFPEKQINSVTKLIQFLTKKYQIKAYNIVGHSDIAIPSGRKEDPGILFPWQELAKNNLGLWYTDSTKCSIDFDINANLNSLRAKNTSTLHKQKFIKKLTVLGYPSPNHIPDLKNPPYKIKTTHKSSEIKHNSNNLIRNYNMHYRQDKGISTEIDSQDLKILESLLCLKSLLKEK